MSRSYVPHFIHWLGSPPNFYRFAGALRPWLMAAALVAGAIGLYGGLVLAPPDYQQGDAYRIIFIHVPSAWMSLFIYASMAVAGLVALVWRVKLAEVIAMECAPVGAAFTLVTLITGSLWGRPMWGTWWTWDARLTSELVLLFLYIGVIGLYAATNPARSGPYLSRRWCVDAYPEAARRYRGRAPEQLPWTEKIEEPGVMDLIEVAQVTAKLDELLAYKA